MPRKRPLGRLASALRRGGTLVGRLYADTLKTGATRGTQADALRPSFSLLAIHGIAPYGAASYYDDLAERTAYLIQLFSKQQQHGTKEGRSAGHLAPPLPMLLYICNKCIYMSEAGKPRRYWARGLEKAQKRLLKAQKRLLKAQKRLLKGTKKITEGAKRHKKDY